MHNAGGGEAGKREVGDRPGAGKHVVGELGGERGVGIIERIEPPGHRHLGGGVLGVHATEESVAKGGGQHAGPGDVIVLDQRPGIGWMFGEGRSEALEHGVDRRPVGFIGLLAPRKRIVDAVVPSTERETRCRLGTISRC